MPDQRQYAGYSINELPKVNTDDEGKVLAVIKGKWDKSGSQIELPVVSSDDNGKVLGVTEGAWNKMDAPTELPAVTASDNGKFLGVVEGNWGLTGVPDKNSFIIYTEYGISGKYDTHITRDDIVDALRNNRPIYLMYSGETPYLYYAFNGITCAQETPTAPASKFKKPTFTNIIKDGTDICIRTINLNSAATQVESYSIIRIPIPEASDVGKIVSVNANGNYTFINNKFVITAGEKDGNRYPINESWSSISNAINNGLAVYLSVPNDLSLGTGLTWSLTYYKENKAYFLIPTSNSNVNLEISGNPITDAATLTAH